MTTSPMAPLKPWLARRLGLSRLNAAVSHLLARDLNLLSALPEGEEGSSALRGAFLSLIPVLQPTVFCDIGANDGGTALAVRDLAPDCAVYGFEANPRIHARHAASMAARGVEWLNIAVTDMSGRAPVFTPRTLSRAYVNGQVVPAEVVEPEDTGKTSLLERNEEATYDRFEVEARTLDELFSGRPSGAGERRFFLWIDVEGAADKVLAGAGTVLEDTQAIFVEAENFDFWRGQKRAGEILDLLYRKGFLPVARDREYGDKQFNMLFVSARAAPALGPALFDASSALRACLVRPSTSAPSHSNALPAAWPAERAPAVPRFTSVRGWLQVEVPVFVPCFNNPTYARDMLRQLRTLGFRRVVLVDNASTSPAMRDWLSRLGGEADVVALAENLGPRDIFLDPRNFALLPRHFVVTDPDLALNRALPDGFLGDLAGLSEQHRVGKAGFALDISDRGAMRDDQFRIGERDWKIWEWEAQVWEKALGSLEDGDGVYDADIDTTFALYDKEHFNPSAPPARCARRRALHRPPPALVPRPRAIRCRGGLLQAHRAILLLPQGSGGGARTLLMRTR